MLVKSLAKIFVCGLSLAAVLSACSPKHSPIEQSASGSFTPLENGVLIAPAAGETKALRLTVMSDNIVRVTASHTNEINDAAQMMVVAEPTLTDFKLKQQGDTLTLSTAKISANVSLQSGQISFLDTDGKPLLTEATRTYSPVTADPDPVAADSVAIQQTFTRDSDEALYGLGQHQNGQVNLANENVYMTTYNLIITIPYLVSSKNYGVLWNNNSDTRFGNPATPADINKNLKLYDTSGNAGGITARYYDGNKLLLSRTEQQLNYQFLKQGSNREVEFPAEVANAQDLRIEWEGQIETDKAGEHELLMYSSGYAKLFVDGELKQDRWRMNWNPWYHKTKVALNKGEKKSIKISWQPQGGYFRLLHQEPFEYNQISPGAEQGLTSFASDTAKNIDYFFVAGNNKDEVISGYRKLTGKAVLLPRWAYGFWQSRERYKSQDELLSALKEYRKRKIPIDNIVLDWSYWPQDAWGSHDFDADYFPDPQAMVDEVHDLNAQIMISVWPKFYPTTDNYKALNANGFMFNKNIEENNLDWIGSGYLNAFYDAFNPAAREMFWQQLDTKINKFGFDAWWLDAVEPDIHSNLSWKKRKQLMTPNYLGNGADVFNAYALPHAEAVYQGDRKSAPDTRVFILTRSGFGGIQRTASAIWSGDTVSRWSDLKEQIAAGIGTGLAGMPNWTFDIGGFTPEDRYRYYNGKVVGSYDELNPAELAEWQELNLRWYQFGAFAPLYRSHGQNPYREIYNIAAEDSAVYKSLVWYTKLRYRLLPYIYSQAGDMYHKDGTLMRGLALDFPNDKTAGTINDQYMFGPSFLVSPISEMGATSRTVYLPSNTAWYDFYTGKKYSGGQDINAQAPLTKMPLFVPAGAIIPTAPEVQYTDQIQNAALTLTIYTGADGKFELYEDDGRSYDYEHGEWSRIPFSYSEADKTLHIGARVGSFPEMEKTRTINLRWITGETSAAANFDENISVTIRYSGESVSVPYNTKP